MTPRTTTHPIAPELELLRLLSGATALRARSGADMIALADRADPLRFLQAATDLRVTGLLPLRLPAAAPRLADEVREALALYRDRGGRRALSQQLVGSGVLAQLARSGIRAAPVKGVFWAQWLYGDPAARVSTDVDLLVAPGDLERSVGVLRDVGYAAPADVRGANGLPTLHFRLEHERAPAIELHWRLHWLASDWSQRALDAARETADGTLRFAPEDEVAAALIFAARDGFRGLRHMADVAAAWDRHGDALGARGLEPLLASYPALARTVATAGAVAQRTVGVPFDGLLDPARHRSVSRVALRLADWSLSVDRQQAKADVHLVDGLLTPRGQIGAYVRRAVLPAPEEIVREAPKLAGRPARVWAGRAGHAFRTIARFALAVVLPRPR